MILRQLLAVLVVGLAAVQARADDGVTQSGYSPLYLGVDMATATVPSNPLTPDGAPTVSRASIIRVDLWTPGIALTGTERSGTLETTAETVSQFAARKRVRIAINTNFFAPCCTAAAEPKTVIGLLVSDGKVVSAPGSDDPTQSQAVLAVTRGGAAIIAPASEIRLPQLRTAVAGSAFLVRNGKDVSAASPSQGDPNNPNPRTLVGLSDHGRYLYLVTVDGRVAVYSRGTTNAQSAALMLAIGATDAINLDGGGSTEMVRADDPGHPYIVNTPSGGAERYDGASLGVYALPLPRRPGEHRD